jgi:tetratricopeptide (TPR) repeat protein
VERLRDGTSRLDQFAHQRLDLRSNIGLSYRALGERARRLFRLFALVAAPDFPGWTAAALLGTSLTDAEDVLESLVEAQLLNAVFYPGMRQPRYGFHDLIREYAREQLMESDTDASRRDALGRLLGAWLALAEDAHRKEYGGDYTILHGEAARWRPTPGQTADILGNPPDWWESERSSLTWAVKQAAAAGMDELCWDLALTSIDLFEARGYFDDWRETSELACEAAERAGNRQGHAAMLYSLGTLHTVQKRLGEAEGYFAAARAMFAADENAHGCAIVLRTWALVDRQLGNIEGMLDRYSEALETMRAVGDRIGEAHILSHLAKFRIDEGDGDTGTAEEMLHESLAICREVLCARVEAQVLYRFAELYMATDRTELAREALNQVLRIVGDIGDRIGEAHALYGFGVLQQREGRLDSAQTTLLHGLALARQVGDLQVEGQGLCALAEIALARDDTVAARGRAQEAFRIFEEFTSGLWRARTLIVMSEIDAADGKLEAAREGSRRAEKLLGAIRSNESTRLLARLEDKKSALLVSETSRGGVSTQLPGA